MNDRNPDLPEKDDQIKDLLNNMNDVPADPGFRDRLRESFVSGAIEQGDASETAPALRSRRPLKRIALAVAAALVIGCGWWLLPDAGPWLEVEATAGAETITVDGRAVSTADLATLEAALVPGATVEVPADASMTLVYQDAVLWEVVGGSRMVLPDPAEDAGDASATLQLLVGELRIRTGARFQGSLLTVNTPLALVHVTGSQLSVQHGGMGTCVCVLEGHVEVGKGEADLEPVPPGQRKVIPPDGEAVIIPVMPEHEAGVEEFLQRVGDRLPDR